MKRVFSITLKKIGNVAINDNPALTYQVVAPTAKLAIDKAVVQFKKEEIWSANVVVEQLTHHGPVI